MKTVMSTITAVGAVLYFTSLFLLWLVGISNGPAQGPQGMRIFLFIVITAVLCVVTLITTEIKGIWCSRTFATKDGLQTYGHSLAAVYGCILIAPLGGVLLKGCS